MIKNFPNWAFESRMRCWADSKLVTAVEPKGRRNSIKAKHLPKAIFINASKEKKMQET